MAVGVTMYLLWLLASGILATYGWSSLPESTSLAAGFFGSAAYIAIVVSTLYSFPGGSTDG